MLWLYRNPDQVSFSEMRLFPWDRFRILREILESAHQGIDLFLCDIVLIWVKI